MRRLAPLLALTVFGTFGCKHTGTLTTRTSNQLVLGRLGIPEFPGAVNRCPSANGEGEILKTWDSGKKLVTGTCRGGLMVGGWKAFYENGAVEWEAQLQAGLIVGSDVDQHRVGRLNGLVSGAKAELGKVRRRFACGEDARFAAQKRRAVPLGAFVERVP